MAKKYSVEAEKHYYGQSRADRDALPYEGLSTYLEHSFGHGRFRGLDVLDVGAGEGVYSAYLADKERANQVVAFDLTPHRMRTGYMTSLGNLHFVAGDVFNMPFRERVFSVVFMNLVLHHLVFDLREALESVGSVLRPGGRLLAIEPNLYNPGVLLLHWWRNRSPNEGFLWPHTTKRLLQSLGFVDVRTGYFWRDRAGAKNPLLGSSFFVEASKRNESPR